MKKMAAILAGAMLMFTFSTSANALSIKFSETGYTDVVVNDTDGDGMINLNTKFGDFSVLFIGGSSSLPNNPTLNSLSVNSFFVTNTAGSSKTLSVQISDTGYKLNPAYPTPLNALVTFGASGLGAGTNGTFSAYLDTNNTIFGKSTPIGTWGPNQLTGASSTIKTPIGLTDVDFSLTEVISLTQLAGNSANFNANVEVAPVPEPGTMVLLGFGMLGLAIYGKRRMNNKEA